MKIKIKLYDEYAAYYDTYIGGSSNYSAWTDEVVTEEELIKMIREGNQMIVYGTDD